MKEHGHEEFLFEEQLNWFVAQLQSRDIRYSVDYEPLYFGDVIEGETTYGWVVRW